MSKAIAGHVPGRQAALIDPEAATKAANWLVTRVPELTGAHPMTEGLPA